MAQAERKGCPDCVPADRFRDRDDRHIFGLPTRRPCRIGDARKDMVDPRRQFNESDG
jgi:hypothetical protein